HPERGLRLRVEAGDLQGSEPVAAGHLVDGIGVVDDDGEAVIGRRVHLGDGVAADIGEGLALHLRIFAGDAAHGQLVAAVGGDVDVEGDLVEAGQGDRVVAGPTGRAEIG